MLYQKLLKGDKPYYINIGRRVSGFVEHRHPELEFCWCIDGELLIDIDKRNYRLKTSQLAIVGSMTPHSLPKDQPGTGVAMTIVCGPTLLLGFFEPFSKAHFTDPVVDLDEHPELEEILHNLEKQSPRHTASSELACRGELYRMSAYVLDNFVTGSEDRRDIKARDDAARIESALELIHNSYSEPLSVRYVASRCGYSDSNFCKIFRQITGDTFHASLNRRRCEMACTLLENTNTSVEDIAGQVGFADSKSLCRVFGKCMGTSPGNYRKTRNEK